MSYHQNATFGSAINCDLEVDFFSSSHRNGGPYEPHPAPHPAMYSSTPNYQTVPSWDSFGGFDGMYLSNPLAISCSIGGSYPATVPSMYGNGYSSGVQGRYMGGFGSPYPQSYSAAAQHFIDPFSAFGPSELPLSLPPSSCQVISPIRSPVDEYASDPQLLVPQPSLAGPSVYANTTHQPVDMGIGYGFGPVNMGAEAAMLGQHAPASSQFPSIHETITREERSISTSNIVSPIGTTMEVPSPAPPPPPPSSLPPLPASPPAPRKKARRARKTRSSVSKEAKSTKPTKPTKSTKSTKSTKASAATSTVPCTEPGCEVLCFDQKTRDRHARSHNRTAYLSYYCPGMYIPRDSKLQACCCKESGYTREDALVRHLRAAEPENPCATEANKFGWDANVKGSVQRLRGILPQPPPQ